MKLKIENQNLQDNEVQNWWNDEKTKKWHHYTYDEKNYLSAHLILRQQKVLDYLKSLKLKKGSKILELGCGAGQTAKKICELGYNYTGIDISKHLILECENKCKEYVNDSRAKFLIQSIEKNIPIQDKTFDVCIVVGAMQYVGNLKDCLQNVHRTLKDDGHFIICQANMYPILKWINPKNILLHLIYFIFNEEFLISPSFKSILCESKLKKYFIKYEDSKFMNKNFMLNGTWKLKYKIRKRLFSFRRLKFLLNNFNFELKKKTCATFFHPKKNKFYYFWFTLDFILQKLVDFKIMPFLINISDNIVILAKKK